MSKKKLRIGFVIVAILIAITIPVAIFACPHENTESVITIPATCTEKGREEIICLDCGCVVKRNKINPTGHTFSDYELTVKPTPDTNGVETAVCVDCEVTDEREYVCTHGVRNTKVTQPSTCSTEGVVEIYCNTCNLLIEKQSLVRLKCEFGEWVETEYATPFEEGERTKTCVKCGRVETESFTVSMPSEDSIYIPGTGICHPLTVKTFSQSAIDANDMVYDWNYFGTRGPWILGHKYGTLKYLHNTKVGQNIYISIDGEIKTYNVEYSEFAMQNSDWTDIVGQTTGKSVLGHLDGETLHMYTCYGTKRNGRWMILAKLVE